MSALPPSGTPLKTPTAYETVEAATSPKSITPTSRFGTSAVGSARSTKSRSCADTRRSRPKGLLNLPARSFTAGVKRRSRIRILQDRAAFAEVGHERKSTLPKIVPSSTGRTRRMTNVSAMPRGRDRRCRSGHRPACSRAASVERPCRPIAARTRRGRRSRAARPWPRRSPSRVRARRAAASRGSAGRARRDAPRWRPARRLALAAETGASDGVSDVAMAVGGISDGRARRRARARRNWRAEASSASRICMRVSSDAAETSELDTGACADNDAPATSTPNATGMMCWCDSSTASQTLRAARASATTELNKLRNIPHLTHQSTPIPGRTERFGPAEMKKAREVCLPGPWMVCVWSASARGDASRSDQWARGKFPEPCDNNNRSGPSGDS